MPSASTGPWTPLVRWPARCWVSTRWAGAQGLTWKSAADPVRFVFWLTLVPGVLAVLAFLFVVRDPEQSPNPALKFFSTLRELPARFKRYLTAVGILIYMG